MGIWREKSHWKDLSRREDGAHSGFPSGQATAEDHLQKFRCIVMKQRPLQTTAIQKVATVMMEGLQIFQCLRVVLTIRTCLEPVTMVIKMRKSKHCYLKKWEETT